MRHAIVKEYGPSNPSCPFSASAVDRCLGGGTRWLLAILTLCACGAVWCCRAEDPNTSSLFFCILDGHGECGELVSGFFQRELSKAVFNHPAFADDPNTAFKEALHKLEAELLAGEAAMQHALTRGGGVRQHPNYGRLTRSRPRGASCN